MPSDVKSRSRSLSRSFSRTGTELKTKIGHRISDHVPDLGQVKSRLSDHISNAPLIAALLAPFSTLLDIPALTEKWYKLDGVLQADPKASLILSAISLFLNVVANALLLIRFSATQRRWWTVATTASTVCWATKAAVAIVNLIVFGATTRNGPGYSYTEAFFCAIASVCLAGIIAIILVLHYCFNFRQDRKRKTSSYKSISVRIAGRAFMLSITILLFVIGIQALIYDQIEDWGYFNSIYFSIGTMLTIGLGDFVPTTTAAKVLLLPFAVLTISQLANEVSIIIDYYSNRAKARSDAWTKRYQAVMQREAEARNPHADLQSEIELVQEMARHEETISQVVELVWSVLSLTVFWAVGAAIFQATEGWSYGNSFYFVYVFGLSVGFGDFAPETPGGRVFFVLYAVASVPLIVSFAVQSVTGILTTIGQWRRRKYERIRKRLFENKAFQAHRQFVLEHRRTWTHTLHEINQRDVERDLGRDDKQDPPVTTDQDRSSSSDDNRTQNADLDFGLEKFDIAQEYLIDETVRQALKLEAICRKLLVENLPKGSITQTLLVADRNVQIRDVQAVGGRAEALELIWEEEREVDEEAIDDDTLSESNEAPNLKSIARYRETFSKFLVAATQLKKLKGDEAYRFERRRSPDSYKQSSGSDQEPASEIGPGHLEKPVSGPTRERQRLKAMLMEAKKEDIQEAQEKKAQEGEVEV